MRSEPPHQPETSLRLAFDEIPMEPLLRRLGFSLPNRGTRTCCILCDSANPSCFSFKADGRWHCFRCQRSGGKLKITELVLNVQRKDAVKWLNGEFNLGLTRRVLTAAERQAWAEQRRRDRDDELMARFWQIGALRSLDRELAEEKANLLRSFESESADPDDGQEDSGEIIESLTRLRLRVSGLRGSAVLREYRLAAATGPQEASRWVSNGQTDDEHAELIAAAIVNILGHSQQGSRNDS